MSMVGSDLCVEMITLVAIGDLAGSKQERREEDQSGMVAEVQLRYFTSS